MNYIIDVVFIKEVIYPFVIIFLGFLFYLVISSSIKRMFKLRINKMDKRRSKTLCSLINNILKYLILVICFLAILEVYNISTKGIVASLGVAGVVVGLAFQDIIKDFLAGFSIIFENEYAIGDTITVGDFKGKVVSLGLKTTKIQALTGEIKIIANRNIAEVINHSLDDSYILLDISVAYEEKLEEVEKILNRMCIKLEKDISDLISLELQGINELGSSSVDFRLMARTKTMMQYDVRREILKQIKLEFDKENITIPYNQVVVHNARI